MRLRTALIADDSAMTRDMHAEMLRGLGYEVVAVDSGHAAAREVREALESRGLVYDLTLIDFDMPEGDGPSAVRAIRRLRPARLGPILCVTGHPIAQVEAMCFAAGFDAVIQKPLSLEALVAWIGDDWSG